MPICLTQFMKRITLFLLFFILFFIESDAFAAQCTLDTVPSPSVEAYGKNIDKILEAAKKLSTSSTCTKPADAGSYLSVALPAQSVRGLLNALSAVGYDLTSLYSDIRYYFDSSDIMPLPQTQNHQNTILEIQGKILDTSAEIGSKCAQGVIRFTENVPLENSTYKTKDRLIQDVLLETYDQTKHVLIFFRNLVTNVSDREYIDETHFTIAPKWFANEMRKFYSSENIQQCHDEEPRNKKIKEVLKDAFSSWWKYPQAMQIWKDAFNLLLYRSGQLVWSGANDSSKEAQINSIVQAQKWGVWNSRFLINKQTLKEIGNNPENQTVFERAKETAKRIAGQTPGFNALFYRQTIPDLKKENSSGVVNIPKFPTSEQDGLRLASIDKSLYDDYAARKELVSQDKAQDPHTVVGLIQSLEYLELARPIIEEIAEKACKLYGWQGTNVPRPTCQELFNA